MPDIYGYSLRRSFGIQSFVDLGIIDEFTTSGTEITFGNGTAADNPGLNAQLETTSNLLSSSSWTLVIDTPATNANELVVMRSVTPEPRFFRLRWP